MCPSAGRKSGIMLYSSHLNKIQNKDDEIKQLEETNEKIAQQLKKTEKELNDENTKLTTQIDENNSKLQKLQDENTKLTTQIYENEHEVKRLTRNNKESTVLVRNTTKYEIMCVENIMRDLHKADNDASTKSKLVQHLKERIIAFSLHLYVENSTTSYFKNKYEDIKNGYEKKMENFVTREDYDLFVTQKNAVLDAFLKTLSVPADSEDSEKYKLLQKEYKTVLSNTMEEIWKV